MLIHCTLVGRANTFVMGVLLQVGCDWYLHFVIMLVSLSNYSFCSGFIIVANSYIKILNSSERKKGV